ncbi:hypothetical protein [Staphylococcus muscae]|uniref:Phage protein n=1 Tax=Staphylococcus muscae TaxID=1294 RepID=A0ABQ1HW57_9STAP|nr:hypothetical protein [Staphylococcus muscae]PNY98063.1 hypothetical protein CD131_10140 [Staphylococcus muscae]GGA94494.1 hypothetical protein GCM10007183_18360 [Staphylococcus muscae]
MTKPKIKRKHDAPTYNDILKLIKIKDGNIQVMKVEEDVEVRGRFSTVVYGTLSYTSKVE